MESRSPDKRAALDRFLADNPELEELSARLATFNIFRALRIEQAEIRHSNVLAWLLAPGGSHGLGDIVLRRFLSNLLLEKGGMTQGLSAAGLELMDLGDVEIRREYLHTDLLMIDEGNRLVWLVENKVRSNLTMQKILLYAKAAEKEFPGFRVVPVALTLSEEPADVEQRRPVLYYSYAQVLGMLEGVLRLRESQLTESVATFLGHYLDTLRRLTMKDDELVNLCKAIYHRHREAIDLIFELGRVKAFQSAVREALEEGGDYEILASEAGAVWFLPKGWTGLIPENGTAWHHLARLVSVVCWFSRRRDGIRLIFEVSRMDDPALRMKVVESLREAGFRLMKKAFNVDAKYSRFNRESAKVPDMDDAQAVKEAARRLLGKAGPDFQKAETVFRVVFAGVNPKKGQDA